MVIVWVDWNLMSSQDRGVVKISTLVWTHFYDTYLATLNVTEVFYTFGSDSSGARKCFYSTCLFFIVWGHRLISRVSLLQLLFFCREKQINTKLWTPELSRGCFSWYKFSLTVQPHPIGYGCVWVCVWLVDWQTTAHTSTHCQFRLINSPAKHVLGRWEGEHANPTQEDHSRVGIRTFSLWGDSVHHRTIVLPLKKKSLKSKLRVQFSIFTLDGSDGTSTTRQDQKNADSSVWTWNWTWI